MLEALIVLAFVAAAGFAVWKKVTKKDEIGQGGTGGGFGTGAGPVDTPVDDDDLAL